MSSTSSFLDLYESLDVIGNGSFGIIRKVRRKQDGVILARKDIDFERMNERDRKQVVAEVNILKDLNHAHIVQYHDRYVDRDAGMLYILMEFCGGGDLSSVIKQAQKNNWLIPEETVWHYFMQILLALHYCHHPNGNTRPGISGGDGEGKERRAPILHRDLKPENVLLDENNSVKLGDFGLSKVLTQASLANTYVGTPYYMSPELMQEKAYDSKSDIWSLGCLIYELCAHKPPFHEAKTHSELSMAVRNGRIPPLPRGYSQALSSVIKSMLNLNPSMRPSAAQLLQNERLEFAHKVFETQKQLESVKAHKATLIDRERELIARESAFAAHEAAQNVAISHKDGEILALQTRLNEVTGSVASLVQEAVTRREAELRNAVLEYEKVVESRVQRREEEIMEAVRVREAELLQAWQSHEATVRAACQAELEERWRIEQDKLQRMKEEIEEKARAIEESQQKGQKKDKTPLEEVKNILAPLAHQAELEERWRIEQDKLQRLKEEIEEKARAIEESQQKGQKKDKTPLERVKNILAPLAQLTTGPQNTPHPKMTSPIRATRRHLETSADHMGPPAFPLASAMKGVILTETGEPLATPMPSNKLVDIFVDTPKIGNSSLGFAKIFDFDKADEEESISLQDDVRITGSTPTRRSPSKRRPDAETTKTQTKTEGYAPGRISTRANSVQRSPSKHKSVSASTKAQSQATTAPMPSRTAPAPPARRPSRLRRPSVSSRSHAKRVEATATDTPDLDAITTSAVPPSSSSSSSVSSSSSSSASSSSGTSGTVTPDDTTPWAPPATPKYDLHDEENLPSPFLRRFERERGGGGVGVAMRMEVEMVSRANSGGSATITRLKRPSGANLLRVAAAANSAKAAGSVAVGGKGNEATATGTMTRTSVRRAGEEARKALLRR